MKSHARYSPSKLESLEQCPKFEYRDTSGAAQEGTDMHSALETGDTTLGLTMEQLAAVDMVERFVGTLVDGLRATDKHGRGPVRVNEVKLRIPKLTWGYADIVLVSANFKVGHVIDAKFGRLEVPHPETNFQVWCYVTALMLRFKSMKECWGHIAAPRVEEPFQSYCFDRSIVEKTRARIEALYAKLADPFLPATPCAELCGKCAHAGRCPALLPVVAKIGQRLGLPIPSVFDLSGPVTPEDRALAQALVKVTKNWGEQVNEKNRDFVAAGGIIPGFKMVERSTGMRVPVDRSAEAQQALAASGFATQDLLLAASTPNIGRLVELGQMIRGTSVDEEKDKLRNILTDIVSEGRTRYLKQTKEFDELLKLLPMKGGDQTSTT